VPHAARTPEGTRVYAIGDIHGRADLLLRLHKLIAEDAATAAAGRLVLVYLGDYVDRGEGSRQVIELLLESPLQGFETVWLRGNHEELMSTFLEDVSISETWMLNGADATLMSYGVDVPAKNGGADMEAAQQALRAALPAAHRKFLKALRPSHVEGGYLFVHAGVRPGVALHDQDPQDLIWIRQPFLSSDADHGHCVVHGHTIVSEPEFHANRIAIDTGAYFSNTLTSLVLDGEDRRLLQT